jgi:hypothetical protein
LINYYNIHSYPYVAVIDPRTGEKIAQWSKLDATVFCELVTNFLSDHELPVDGQQKDDDDDVKISNDEDANKMAINGNGKICSQKLPNLKYLSFSDRFDGGTTNGSSPKKISSKQAAVELLKNKSVTCISSSSDSDEDVKIKNVKITSKNGVSSQPSVIEQVVEAQEAPKLIKYETDTKKKGFFIDFFKYK